mgnify:CR=1 FL=1
MKKNDSIELVIEDMGTDGEGIGHVATEDGRSIAVFVKDAVMGDTIRAAFNGKVRIKAFERRGYGY